MSVMIDADLSPAAVIFEALRKLKTALAPLKNREEMRRLRPIYEQMESDALQLLPAGARTAQDTVRQALRQTRAAEVLTDKALHEMVDAACVALGFPIDFSGVRPERYQGPDAALANAARAVLTFVPAEHDGAYQDDLAEEIANDHDGDTDGEDGSVHTWPLFSEGVLYPLLGKDAARTLLSHARALEEQIRSRGAA